VAAEKEYIEEKDNKNRNNNSSSENNPTRVKSQWEKTLKGEARVFLDQIHKETILERGGDGDTSIHGLLYYFIFVIKKKKNINFFLLLLLILFKKIINNELIHLFTIYRWKCRF
jgi:hypothetical protein